MMIDELKDRIVENSETFFLSVAGVIFLIVIVTSLVKVVSKPDYAPPTITGMGEAPIDFSIMDNRTYNNLILFESSTLPEKYGRGNPFVPYSLNEVIEEDQENQDAE